jgi:hypothetical protein
VSCPFCPIGLPALGKSHRGHEVLHALFGLVFDGVCMVWADPFEKFLKMVFRLPCLALEVVLSDRDILLLGVVRFLVVVAAAGSNYDPLGASFLLPLDAFFSAFADGFRRCHLAWLLSGAIFPSPRTKMAPTPY